MRDAGTSVSIATRRRAKIFFFVFYFRWDVEFVLGTELKETNDIVPVVVEVSAYGDAGVA